MLSKTLVHQKGCYIYQWLDNVDMHLYAKCDQNMPCGSRVMSIFTNANERTDGRTHIVIIVQTQTRSVSNSRLRKSLLLVSSTGSYSYCQIYMIHKELSLLWLNGWSPFVQIKSDWLKDPCSRRHNCRGVWNRNGQELDYLNQQGKGKITLKMKFLLFVTYFCLTLFSWIFEPSRVIRVLLVLCNAKFNALCTNGFFLLV